MMTPKRRGFRRVIFISLRPCPDLVTVPKHVHGARALKWTFFTHAGAPETKNVYKQVGKGNSYREISGKYRVGGSNPSNTI